MLTMIVHSRGNAIPYNIISDLSAVREPEGKHIPLPAKSNRERAEMIEEFIRRAVSDTENVYLLVVAEELNDELDLERRAEIDCILYNYIDNQGRPAVSVWKNGIGDEGVTYEEFVEDLRNFSPDRLPVEKRPKVFTKRAA